MPAPTVLTSGQIATLKTFFQNDASFSTLRGNVGTANEDRGAIAALFNSETANANPWVFKTKVTKHEVTNEASIDATSFSYSAFIGRSQGERDGWREVWNTSLTCDPSLDNVRAAFADIFSGAGGSAMRTHLLACGRRKATVAERLLTTGFGSGAAATPDKLGWEGLVTIDNVVVILS